MLASLRITRVIAGLVLALGLSFALTAPASAQPTSGPVVHDVDAVGDFTYDALFTVGVQVYEVAKQTPIPNSSGGIDVMYKRLYSPRDGKPGSIRLGFVGQQLYPAFRSPYWPRLGQRLAPTGIVSRVDPTTWRDAPSGQAICVSFGTPPVSRLSGVYWSKTCRPM